MRNLRQTRTHHQQTNQAKTDHMAGAEDLPAEVVVAQVEVVVVATAEGSTITIITMGIEDTARRSHLNRAPENPSNLLQAVTRKTETRELARRTEWATLYVT